MSDFYDRIKALPVTQQRLLAADYVEHVLPFFKDAPGQFDPRRAIEAARAFARGGITAEELQVVAADECDADTSAAWAYVADAAFYATGVDWGLSSAARTALAAVGAAAGSRADHDERAWQERRLSVYEGGGAQRDERR